MPSPNPPDDPREKGFRTRASVADVQDWIDTRFEPIGSAQNQFLCALAGRVLSADVVSAVDVPGFDRAAMDGYAIRGEESFGAEPYSPLALRVVGRARPGESPELKLKPGEAIEIATGAPIPEGADAVARVEGTRRVGESVHLHEATPPGRHIGRRGEDIAAGTRILEKGRRLRPQDLGLLSAIGLERVRVIRKPRVAIFITGDELLPPGSAPVGSRIADANGPMLLSLVTRDGGDLETLDPLPDDRSLLRRVIARGAETHHLVIVSGGSSTGPEDHAPSIVAELGQLHYHGIAIRPASPAGIGMIGETPVVLLPGNPVSCLCAYDFFAGRILRRLGGLRPEWPYRPMEARLASKLVSTVGRVDYARVRMVEGHAAPIAVSGASILSSTTRADGFVVVPEDLEGYPEGGTVTVWLYD